MRRLSLCLVLGYVSFSAAYAADRDSIAYVNTLIGTQRSAIGYGGTMPFVTPPFGMTDWAPQTRQNKISVTSYNYDDTTISGFIGTHQPAIWMGDYGYVTIMPQTGTLRTTAETRKLPYKHSTEQTHPDYYAISLDAGEGSELHAEMTATTRCAMMRFRFPKIGVARVLVEASRPGIPGYATVDAQSHEITGYDPHRMDAHLGPYKLPKFKGYFVVQFRQIPQNEKTYGMGDQTAASGRGAYAEFKPGETVEMRIGTSFLSIDQARSNLKAELPDWNFEAARQRLRAAWNEKLNRMQVEGAT
jgi:putative alpha-1,2-mannosidase